MISSIEPSPGAVKTRRSFLGDAALSVALAALTLNAAGENAKGDGLQKTRFRYPPTRQIEAGVLNIGYVDQGPSHGPAVILLHGWPYDIHSFVEVSAILVEAGYRVIVPHLRGYGTTQFLSTATMRNAQPSAFALDIIALMDALNIQKAIVGGFDWGARTADILAALWPDRCIGLVSVSGFLVGTQKTGALPLPPPTESQWWYQF